IRAECRPHRWSHWPAALLQRRLAVRLRESPGVPRLGRCRHDRPPWQAPGSPGPSPPPAPDPGSGRGRSWRSRIALGDWYGQDRQIAPYAWLLSRDTALAGSILVGDDAPGATGPRAASV